MDHMDNRRKNIQSTKQDTRTEDPQDFFPDQPEETTRSNYCFLIAVEPRSIVYSDQTGLPQSSESGNNYLLVAYDFDSNAILLRPIKNRAAGALSEAIQNIHDTLSKGGCQPKFHRLDNDCPKQVEAYFQARVVRRPLEQCSRTGHSDYQEPSGRGLVLH
jgi:hypothetical protein